MILVLLNAFVGSLAGLWLFVKVAPRLGLVDQPGSRSQHATPTPVGAGAVVVATLIYCFLLFPDLTGEGFADLRMTAAILGALMAIGLVDDRINLSSGLRLLIYFGAAGLFLFIEIGQMSLWLFALLMLAFVWIINLFNFMDGIDGFAITQALLVFVGMALILTVSELPAALALVNPLLVLIVACFPLVFFNWPPASLFMGDAGSISLGFILGAIGLKVAFIDVAIGWAWLILMMPFILDATLTLIIRLLAGKPPHLPHRDHAYQRLVRITDSAAVMNLGLLLLHLCWLFPLALLSLGGIYSRIIAVILATIPPCVLLVYARREA